MPEMHLKQPICTYNACRPFNKQRKNENFKKQEIHDTFIKMSLTKFVSQITRLMEILKI